MADWMVFLEDVAIECGLSPEQKIAFLARFDRANLSRKNKWIVENTKDIDGRQVFAGEDAFTKLMTGIYGAVQKKLFPDLKQAAKGKQGKLETFLKAEFERRSLAPQPPILGEPSQDGVQSPPELGDLGGGQVPQQTTKSSGLKPGAPRPRVRLPENFVTRSDALQKVKGMLLRESERTLVVSAIAGLGGLGKSVLATALVLDEDVQERFADGILWVTLGQNPDLLGLIGEWIRELDKSRESFSATTLESASGYLHNLLVERRMLLVVDDVWNAAHADWFRVGGSGCRVLVTTREAQIAGADYYPLDLMTEGEAIALVKGKLGSR
jgi:hypothetical protein